MATPSATSEPSQFPRQPVILVVDGDEHIRKLLHFHLRRTGCQVLQADSGDRALELLGQNARVDLVLLDLHLQGLSGLDTLRAINAREHPTTVIVMSRDGTVADATAAMREGAYDFVNKTNTFDNVHLAIRNALNTVGLRREVEELKAQLDEREQAFGEIIGRSPAIAQVLKLARKVRDSDITVLVLGESGSGKEMVARAIHEQGKIRGRPFVALNCAAIPESLLESELFGHERGSFTGATARRIGKFQEANEGTLFLDEIGELSAALQAKLLRVLQTREIQPIGGQPTRINVRIVSATNQDLERLVKDGRFRLDLYYRLAVFPIHVPPLRERREDIPSLADHFLQRFARQEHKGELTLHADVRARLLDHPWDGNVRELENMIYRAVVLADSPQLGLADFPMLGLVPRPGFAPQRSASPLNTVPQHNSALPLPLEDASAPLLPEPEPARVVPLEQLEARAIAKALASTGGNMSRAALQLGIGRATLYRKTKKYGLAEG
jgi:DNA-binding NtrC family response regulator